MIFNKKKKNLSISIPEGFHEKLILCLKKDKLNLSPRRYKKILSPKGYKTNFKFKPHKDYFLYIAGKIVDISSYKKFKNLSKVPISSVILRMELGKNYKRYIEYLIEHKFIETDNYYVVGNGKNEGKCKCYGFHRRFRNVKLIDYKIKKKTLLKKFLKWKEEKFGKMANDELLGKLYTMMRKFKIDMKGVEEYLNEEVENKRLSKRKAQLELTKCKRINNRRDPYSLFLVKDTYGRVHTNFTNISKHIRENFITLNDKKLIQLDVISCQPALLYVIFKEHILKTLEEAKNHCDDDLYLSPFELYNTGVDVRDKYVNNRNSYYGDKIYENDFHPMIRNFGFASYVDMSESAVAELEKYKKVLKSGIYEFFQEKWKELFKEEKTRKEIKKEWIPYIFGRNDSKKGVHMRKIWLAEFPLLTKFLEHFKYGNHRPLAHELQRRESNLIYNKVCPKIDALEMDYFTVHDCIVVPEGDGGVALCAFNDILKENDVVTGVSV